MPVVLRTSRANLDLVEAAFPVLVDPDHRDDARLAAFWSQMAHEIGPDVFCTQLEAVVNR